MSLACQNDAKNFDQLVFAKIPFWNLTTIGFQAGISNSVILVVMNFIESRRRYAGPWISYYTFVVAS